MAPGDVCWLSVDPVRRKVDFYPKAIALRIEKAYHERDRFNTSECVLGKDFFNATVHFHPSGSCYQTTPGMSMGRAGFKQPGYRSVMRHVNDGSGQVIVLSKQVHGEWRIAANESDAEVKFDEAVPVDSLVESSGEAASASLESFKAWDGADLTSGAWDAPVVVWQWCRGVPERQGNLMALGDEWWCPYLPEENCKIEDAFSAEKSELELSLPQVERLVRILFTSGQTFALQRDESRGAERTVRRVVKTVQEVKFMLDRMAHPPVEASELTAVLPDGAIPQHFFCPILQDIMEDPVKTVDGHTYHRSAIERWFTLSQTSPLTGLPLASTALEPHVALRDQINEFKKKHEHLLHK